MTLILTSAALAFAGCGTSSVAADDVANVLEAQDAINTTCGLTENQGGSDIPLPEAIKTLQSVYESNPEGTFAAGVSTNQRNMETIVEDNAGVLRKCGRRAEADELASVLRS